jgi:8-oxo-dGTP pyrophosphatase MutT (NUDIX family)
MPLDRLHSADINRRLNAHRMTDHGHETPLPGLHGEPTPAAVLLPLFRQREQWRVLFIRRAVNRADRHSGEVAFPGGRIETQDPHADAAALREAQEEISLRPQAVELLGRLPAFRTASNYLVTPVVGRLPWPLELVPDEREVARIFSIPLSWLADAGNREIRPWQPPGYRVSRNVVFFREYDGERLWGVSARITLSLLEALGASQRDEKQAG